MRKLIIFSFIALAVLFLSCKKSSSEQKDEQPSITDLENLTEEDNAFFDSISVLTPPLQEMLGYNGNPLARTGQAQSAISDLVDGLLRQAQALSSEKETVNHTKGTSEFEPEHMGYAYSKGQRDLSARLNPPNIPKSAGGPVNNALHREYAVYGVDCSGFIYNLFKRVGANIEPFITSSFEKTLKTFLENSSTYAGFTVENLGKISRDKIKRGDFILWLGDRNHMGIVAELTNGNGDVFQSNGTGFPKDIIEQNKNLGKGRGIHPLSLEKCLSKPYWGTNYLILRINGGAAATLDEVVIGTQTWMAKNLDVSTYKNGDPIALARDLTTWNNVSGAYCYYNLDPSNENAYGKLYSTIAITDTRGIAPKGWHIPTESEVRTLRSFLDQDPLLAGGKIKQAGTALWKSPNLGANNSSGFTALPGGYCGQLAAAGGLDFSGLGENGWFWFNNPSPTNSNGAFKVDYQSAAFYQVDNGGGNWGFSIRCIKD